MRLSYNDSEYADDSLDMQQKIEDIQESEPVGTRKVCGDFEIMLTGKGWVVSKYFGFADESAVVIPSRIGGKQIVAIGEAAFKNCKGLSSLTIEEGITEIGAEAFLNTDIMFLRLPETLESIGDSAFSYTKKVASITLPERLQRIGTGCFESSGIEEIRFGSKIRIIPKSAFSWCKNLEKVDLPDSLWSIESNAFSDCGKLKRIYIPMGTRSISVRAFSGCRLERIAIPSSVIKIGNMGSNGITIYRNEFDRNIRNETLGYGWLSKMTVYCEAGSVAMAYAKEHNYRYLRYEDFWKN